MGTRKDCRPPAQPATNNHPAPTSSRTTPLLPRIQEDVEAIGHRQRRKRHDLYALEKEKSLLCNSLAQEVERSSKLIDDPVVTEYVNRVGKPGFAIPDARVPSTIKVIVPRNQRLRAARLLLLREQRLIPALYGESELAGVMAHEICHVTARTAPRNPPKANDAARHPSR